MLKPSVRTNFRRRFYHIDRLSSAALCKVTKQSASVTLNRMLRVFAFTSHQSLTLDVPRRGLSSLDKHLRARSHQFYSNRPPVNRWKLFLSR
ncbi:MAG: hypothetical protein ACTS4U_01870 [Candidatus Hodgkinia cicadicola]